MQLFTPYLLPFSTLFWASNASFGKHSHLPFLNFWWVHQKGQRSSDGGRETIVFIPSSSPWFSCYISTQGCASSLVKVVSSMNLTLSRFQFMGFFSLPCCTGLGMRRRSHGGYSREQPPPQLLNRVYSFTSSPCCQTLFILCSHDKRIVGREVLKLEE